MTIQTHLAILNIMSSFVPKYWLNWQILVLFLINFADKDGTTKVYIPVHPWKLLRKKWPWRSLQVGPRFQTFKK